MVITKPFGIGLAAAGEWFQNTILHKLTRKPGNPHYYIRVLPQTDGWRYRVYMSMQSLSPRSRQVSLLVIGALIEHFERESFIVGDATRFIPIPIVVGDNLPTTSAMDDFLA